MEPVGKILIQALDGDAESILLIFAVYFLLTGTFSLCYQLRVKKWPHKRGRLLRSRIAHVAGFEWDSGDKSYATDALYEYQVDGQAYQGHKKPRRTSPMNTLLWEVPAIPFLKEFTTKFYAEFMQKWEKALNHYLKAGTKLPDL